MYVNIHTSGQFVLLCGANQGQASCGFTSKKESLSLWSGGPQDSPWLVTCVPSCAHVAPLPA